MLMGSLTADAQQQIDKERLKQANSYFEEGAYLQALGIFRQLLSITPEDKMLNYKYGACLIYSDEDTEEPVKYLKYGASDSNDPLAYYFLGKALHLNYQFADAQKAYTNYLSKADNKLKEKFPDGELLVQMTKNGQTLLSEIKDIVVIDKTEASEKEFFRSYKIDDLGGKIIVTPDELLSKNDKESGEYFLIYFQGVNEDIYFSSYGNDDQRDIYKAKRLDNGKFTKPVKLGGGVNTQYDENYAYMHPDGQTMYFSSKGHNSMGGYDIFKSIVNPNSGDFGQAENLDFAISSPDDDIFYIADLNKENAFFASGRSSELGRLNVYNVKVKAGNAAMAVIKGQFIASESNKTVSIRIEDAMTNNDVGVFTSDPKTGEYLLNLPKSGKYKFYVEEEGSNTIHSGMFEVPRSTGNVAYAQEMTVTEIGGTDQLVLNNLFEEPLEDDISMLMAEAIKRKAQLDINKDDFVEEEVEEVDINEAYVAAGFQRSSSNQSIKEEAQKEAEKYSSQSMDDIADAQMLYAYSREKRQKADELMALAKIAYEDSKVEQDVSKKEELILEAAYKKLEAAKENTEAANAIDVLKKLDKNSQNKYERYESFAKNIEEINSRTEANDFENLVIALEEHKVLTSKGEMPGTLELIQEEQQEKRRQASRALTFAQKIEEEKTELSDKLGVREKQLNTTTKKKDKEIIEQDIAGMKEELADYEVQVEGAYKRYETRLTDQANSENQGKLYSNYKLRRENDVWSTLSPQEYSVQELAELDKDLKSSKREANKIKIDDVEISQLLAKRTDISHKFDFGDIVRDTEVTVNETEIVFQPKDPEELEFVEDEKEVEDLVVINKNIEAEDDYQMFLVSAAQKDNSVSVLNDKINIYKTERETASPDEILILDKRISDLETMSIQAQADIDNAEKLAALENVSQESIEISDEDFSEDNKEDILAWISSEYSEQKQNIIDGEGTDTEKQVMFNELNNNTSLEIARSKAELMNIYTVNQIAGSVKAKRNLDYLTEMESEFSDNSLLLPTTEIVDVQNIIDETIDEDIVDEREATTDETIAETNDVFEDIENSTETIADETQEGVSELAEDTIDEAEEIIDDSTEVNTTNSVDGIIDETIDVTENEFDDLNVTTDDISEDPVDTTDNTINDVETLVEDIADGSNSSDNTDSSVDDVDAFTEDSTEINNVDDILDETNEFQESIDDENVVDDIVADEVLDDVEIDGTELIEGEELGVDTALENELVITPKFAMDELIFDEESSLSEGDIIKYAQTGKVEKETTKYFSDLNEFDDGGDTPIEVLKEKTALKELFIEELKSKKLSNISIVKSDPNFVQQATLENQALNKIEDNVRLELDKDRAEIVQSSDIYFSQKELVKARYRSDYIDELKIIEQKELGSSTKAKHRIILDNMIAFELEKEIARLDAEISRENISDLERQMLIDDVEQKRKDYNEIRWTNTISLSEIESPVTEEELYERHQERSYMADGLTRQSDYTDLINVEGYKRTDLHYTQAKVLQKLADIDLLILENNKASMTDSEYELAEIEVADKLAKANEIELSEINLELIEVNFKNLDNKELASRAQEYMSLSETWNRSAESLEQLSSSATGTQKNNMLKERIASQLNAIEYSRRANAIVNYLSQDNANDEFVFSDFVIPNSEISPLQEDPNYTLVEDIFDERYTPPNYLLDELVADENSVNNAATIEGENMNDDNTTVIENFVVDEIDETTETANNTIDEITTPVVEETNTSIIPDSLELLTAETLTDDNEREAVIRLNNERVKKAQPVNSNGVILSGERANEVESDPAMKKTQSALVYYKKRSLIEQLNEMKVEQIDLQQVYAEKIYTKEQGLIVVDQSIEEDGRTEVLTKEHNRLVAELAQLRKYNAIAKDNVLSLDNQVDVEESSLASLKQAMDEEDALAEFEVVEELNIPSIPDVLTRNIYVRSNSAEAGYSEANPIPVDPVMPSGVIYQVQVGAYRQPIPQDLFKGFTPIMGERIQSGITRYKVGLFTSYNNANTAKEEIRGLGYADAFVVVFNDGNRISLAEARRLATEDLEDSLADDNPTGDQQDNTSADVSNTDSSTTNNTANNTTNSDNTIEENTSVENTSNVNNNNENVDELPEVIDVTNGTGIETLNTYIFVEDENKDDYYADPDAAEAKQVEMIKGLFYTVQIGAYSKPVTSEKLLNVSPLNTELTDKGLIRYTTGRFTDINKVSNYKTQIVDNGIQDAFVSAYYNGFRITLSKAKELFEEQGAGVWMDSSIETDEVVRFDNAGANVIPANNITTTTPDNTTTVPAENNSNIVDRPKDEVLDAAYSLVENGMPGQMIWDLLEEEGLLDEVPEENQTYKVILGPFIESIPTREVEIILNFRDNIRFEERENNAYVYSSINPIPYAEARKLKETLEAEGIDTAKIVSFKGGREISLKEFLDGLSK